jgi:lipid A 3-O-deacylase
MIASGETLSVDSSDNKGADRRPASPVSNDHKWEFGPFVNWGTGVGERSDYKFVWAGAQMGRSLFAPVHAGIFSGQFELGGNIMPFWQAYTPPQGIQTVYTPGPGCPAGGCVSTALVGGGTFRGVSVEPVIFRWNFLNHSQRFKPWFQAAGGVIYTTHKFPPSQLIPRLGTCVWNFSPQGGTGFHYFLRPNRSLDVGVNAVHISSASLGDHNPGVNASIQIQVGYTYWK